MSKQDNTLVVIATELGKAFLPLSNRLSSLDNFRACMAQLGWDGSVIPQPIQDLVPLLNELADKLTEVASGEELTESDITALIATVSDLAQAIQIIEAASDSLIPPILRDDNFKEIFPRQLLDFLLVEYLTFHQPKIAHMLGMLGIIRIRYEEPQGNRPGYMSKSLAFEDIPQIFSDPLITIKTAYGWGTDDLDTPGLLRHIDKLLVSFGADVYIERTGLDNMELLADGTPDDPFPSDRALKAPFFEKQTDSGLIRAGIGLFPLPKIGDRKPGISLQLFASGSFDERVEITENLFFLLKTALHIEGGMGLLMRPDEPLKPIIGIDDPSSATSESGSLKMRLEHQDPSREPKVLIGSADGSRLELKTLSAEAGLLLDAQDDLDLYTELELQGGRLVIAAGQGDGFLQNVLPPDGINTNFDLALGWSSQRGIYFRGSGGLEVRVPTHVEVAGVKIETVTIALNPSDRRLPINLGTSVRAELGPLQATVENLGLTATFEFPGSGGNLGPLDLDIDFKPPTGIGLAIDGGGFTGGGSLYFDPKNERYVGGLQLEFQKTVTVNAMGLLTTRLPGGQPGFSLLIMISSEFTPIQLGLGFTLNGVGGLLGLNRTMRVERLREGIKSSTLDNILFPTDPVANADRIISDVRQVFPAQGGRFVFGPMAQIGWGTPNILTIELGLLIEIPSPVRLAMPGVLKALLPDEKAKLLQLRVNFLGVIDFEKEQLAFDASLYESRLLSFTLAGDMALRLNWGEDPNFLLSVGGFHPAYEPPADLAAMKRITLNLLGGKNPRLTLEHYFAITSNTVQFGAKVELYARAWKFNVYGFLSFDVLFQFSPFYFIADISAGLALRLGSSTIASIHLSFALSGTTPWNAKGTARFKLCWFITIKVRFDKSWGERRDTTLPDVPVLPLLKEALQNTDNWRAETPARLNTLVVVKDLSAVTGVVLVHPFGTLTVSQRVVPLDMTIAKFGNAKPADADRFSITRVTSDSDVLDTSEVREQFAPAQFREMTDAKRLDSKSFEKLKSGVAIKTSEGLESSYVVTREAGHEQEIIDSGRSQRSDEVFSEKLLLFNAFLSGNAAARSPLSHARKARSPLAPPKISIDQERFAVVNSENLTMYDDDSLAASQAEALDHMAELIASQPALAGAIQVVPAYEVNGHD